MKCKGCNGYFPSQRQTIVAHSPELVPEKNEHFEQLCPKCRRGEDDEPSKDAARS